MTAPDRPGRPDPLGGQIAEPLHPIEVMELADLLGMIEDWLLHAGWDVHDSLTRFAGYDLISNPEAGIRNLIDTVGTYAVRLTTLPVEPAR